MSNEVRIWIWLAFILVLGGLLYLLAPVLTPFVISALLAYLGDPVVDRIDRVQSRFSRTWAVVTVFLFIILLLLVLLLILIPLLERQVEVLVRRLPAYLEWLQKIVIPWLQSNLGIDQMVFDLSSLKAEISRYLDKVGGYAVGFLSSVSRSSAIVFSWIMNLLLIPVLTFYLLRDWDILVARIRDLLPRRIEPVIVKLVTESDEVLGAFLRGQFLVMLALGIIYAVGLAVIGLDFALLIGMLAGLVSFVPYLGFIVGVLAASAAAIFQFQDIIHVVLVLMVFGIGQVIEGTVLTPWFVGERIGLHPVAVIFAVLTGGYLFGFFGVLLALPVAAVVMVLLRHTHDEYLKSVFYHD